MISSLITCPFIAYEPSLKDTHYDLDALCLQQEQLYASAKQCKQDKMATASAVLGLLLLDLVLVIVTSSIMCHNVCGDDDGDVVQESVDDTYTEVE